MVSMRLRREETAWLTRTPKLWDRRDCQKLEKNRFRPLRLDRVALTNDPNIKGMEPISNRSEGNLTTEPAGSTGTTEKRKDTNMITDKGKNKLLAFHGLDPEKHSDEDVDNEIKNASDKREKLQNRADKAEGELVDQDLTRFSNRIGTNDKVKAHWKKALIENRASAIEMLEALPEPTAAPNPNAGKQPVHNRARAGTPEAIDGPDKDAARTKENALIKNRAEKLEKDGMASATAWIQASKEIPEEIKAGLHK
jgi:hypothetical protein